MAKAGEFLNLLIWARGQIQDMVRVSKDGLRELIRLWERDMYNRKARVLLLGNKSHMTKAKFNPVVEGL